MSNLTRAELAHMVDHTLLAPTATPADVAALVRRAPRLGSTPCASRRR